VAYSKVAEAPYVPAAQMRRGVAHSESGPWGKIAIALFILFACYLCWARPWVHHERPQHALVADASSAQPEVILYGTSWCPYCAKARDFFETHGIKYTEYDIEHDATAEKSYREVHGRGVPVVVVADEVIQGYDPDAMAELLQPWMR
jgi:glutaredoxin